MRALVQAVQIMLDGKILPPLRGSLGSELTTPTTGSTKGKGHRRHDCRRSRGQQGQRCSVHEA